MTLRDFGMRPMVRAWPATLGNIPGGSTALARHTTLLQPMWVVALGTAVLTLVAEYTVTFYRWSSAGFLAWDARHHMDAALRFGDTGTPYLSAQVAGPFTYGDPFGSLWLDWISVVRNSPGSLTYSIASMVPMLMPVVAWSARETPDR